MLVDLKNREISLKVRLYETELRAKQCEEDFTELERHTTARRYPQEYEARRLDLTARLWLYEYSGEAIKSDDPETVRRFLEPLYSDAKTTARELSASDKAGDALEVIHAGRVASEAATALRILRDAYNVETIDLPEEVAPSE